ncbi:MATE family efflux transporter [Metabacillus indicus]|uniref:MATE family efflux transporter n=1 Tax=Metabacillus indicus TaxID=246786 RepID=UPI002A038E19|nr:MATE family efflux transporter [Metabacillus indicus]MDX8291649.1 MATE family efflux transporter [Metabacillus indicus]
MKQTYSLWDKSKQFFHILLPILITQVALYSMNFFDTTMSGKVSPGDLAGVAIGSSVWVPVYTGLSGILLAVTPIVSQYAGAKQRDKIPFTVIQGLYLSVLLASAVALAGFFVLDPILHSMNLEAHVRETAKYYLAALALGILPLFSYNVLRCFIDALGFTRVSMFITLLSLPINIVFNYLFIFGKFGFPALGGVGAGVASAITYWSIMLISVYVVHKKVPFSDYGIFSKWYKASVKAWVEILKIGIPIGIAIFFETSIFAAVTLLMSTYDTVTIASHQIALNFASLLYMLPLSISMALTIVIGFEVGAKRYKDAKEYSYLGIVLAVLLSLLTAAVIYFFRSEIAGIYTNDRVVVALSAQFLIYAIFFQLSDAIAAPIQGALRGYKDVNVTLLMALVSYWVIGLPTGYYLAANTDFMAFGYWIGLIAGLAAAAVALSARLWFIQTRVYGERVKRKAS